MQCGVKRCGTAVLDGEDERDLGLRLAIGPAVAAVWCNFLLLMPNLGYPVRIGRMVAVVVLERGAPATTVRIGRPV